MLSGWVGAVGLTVMPSVIHATEKHMRAGKWWAEGEVYYNNRYRTVLCKQKTFCARVLLRLLPLLISQRPQNFAGALTLPQKTDQWSGEV